MPWHKVWFALLLLVVVLELGATLVMDALASVVQYHCRQEQTTPREQTSHRRFHRKLHPVAWDIWTPYIDACDCFQTSYSIACLQKDEEARVVGKTCRRNVRQGSNDRLTICFSIKQHDNRRSTFDVACLTQNRLYACSACRGCSVDNLCQVQLCLINTTSWAYSVSSGARSANVSFVKHIRRSTRMINTQLTSEPFCHLCHWLRTRLCCNL